MERIEASQSLRYTLAADLEIVRNLLVCVPTISKEFDSLVGDVGVSPGTRLLFSRFVGSDPSTARLSDTCAVRGCQNPKTHSLRDLRFGLRRQRRPASGGCNLRPGFRRLLEACVGSTPGGDVRERIPTIPCSLNEQPFQVIQLCPTRSSIEDFRVWHVTSLSQSTQPTRHMKSASQPRRRQVAAEALLQSRSSLSDVSERARLWVVQPVNDAVTHRVRYNTPYSFPQPL